MNKEIIITKKQLDIFKQQIRYSYDDKDDLYSDYLKISLINILTQYLEIKEEDFDFDNQDFLNIVNDSRVQAAARHLATVFVENPDILLTNQYGNVVDKNQIYRILGNTLNYYSFDNSKDKKQTLDNQETPPINGELNFISPLIKSGNSVSIDTSEFITTDKLNSYVSLSSFNDLANKVLEFKENLLKKQDILIAGQNIKIENNIISSTLEINTDNLATKQELENTNQEINKINDKIRELPNSQDFKDKIKEIEDINNNQSNNILNLETNINNLFADITLSLNQTRETVNNLKTDKVEETKFNNFEIKTNSEITKLDNKILQLGKNKELKASEPLKIKDNIISINTNFLTPELEKKVNKEEFKSKTEELTNLINSQSQEIQEINQEITNSKSEISNIKATDILQEKEIQDIKVLTSQIIETQKQNRPFNFLGNYQTGQSYKKNEVVLKENILYLSTIDNNNETPPSNNWLIIDKPLNIDFKNFATKTELTEALNNKVNLTDYNNVITQNNNRFSNIETQLVDKQEKIINSADISYISKFKNLVINSELKTKWNNKQEALTPEQIANINKVNELETNLETKAAKQELTEEINKINEKLNNKIESQWVNDNFVSFHYLNEKREWKELKEIQFGTFDGNYVDLIFTMPSHAKEFTFSGRYYQNSDGSGNNYIGVSGVFANLPNTIFIPCFLNNTGLVISQLFSRGETKTLRTFTVQGHPLYGGTRQDNFKIFYR